jgi:hypothetical protein
MRIYWLNPPISFKAIYADVAWMEISSSCPNEEWIEPIIDWDPYSTIEELVEEILSKQPDMVCVSSYVWNERLCSDVLKKIKSINSNIITVRGGPQQTDNNFVDYSCDPLSAGEPFMVELINKLTGSSYTNPNKQFPKESSLVKNVQYLSQVAGIARHKNLPSVVTLETTRGCPYSCTYCEWGGGIGTKITQKPLQNVFDEIDLCSMLKISDIDLADANFGILKRDVDIIQKLADNKKQYGFPQSTYIYGIAKTKLDKKEKVLEIGFESGLMKWFPVPIQGITKEVTDNIKRTDVPLQDILNLALKLREKYNVEPRFELILGLPGSTLNDFYEEMDLTEYSKTWDWNRYVFTVLPATEAAKPFYRALHKIKTAYMFTPESDMREDKGSRNLIANYRSPQEIAVASYSFTKEEWKEMFFMNWAQKVLGPNLSKDRKASEQMKEIYSEISKTLWFAKIKEQLDLLVESKKQTDYLDYDGFLIEDWVTKYYINKEPYGSNN